MDEIRAAVRYNTTARKRALAGDKTMRKITGWFKHPRHGYMLRRNDTCVTALCLDTLDVESDEKAWEGHKLRLHVNGGCGFAAVDEMTDTTPHNAAFVRVRPSSVPAWIVRDFSQYVDDEESSTVEDEKQARYAAAQERIIPRLS